MTRRRVTPWIVALALVAGAVVLLVVVRRRAPAPTPAPAPMAGMQMSAPEPAASGKAAQLTASQIRQFGITFGTAEQRTLESTVRAVGTVTVDETKLSQVVPRFGGYVERLYVAQTGQHVRHGEPLMDVYSPELVAAEQELLVARGLQESLARSTVPGVQGDSADLVTAARRRLALWDISDEQIDRVLRTGKVSRTLTLHAPASGIVLEKHVVQGQAIQPGQMLYSIANLSDVWVDVALRETDAGAVRAGSRATVELTAYPGRPFAGRVAYVYPTLDSIARTVRARIAIANPSGQLKPGMYATAALATPVRAALTVPSSAVVRTGERALVFVDMGSGRLEPREIETGRVTDAFIEVLSGLEPGQRVVTSAQFLLDSESNLGEVMKSMIGQGGATEDTTMKGMSMPPERR
jgi:membrane fusion protein, copper/silver efflux system